MSRAAGIASVFALGVVLMLAASPAAALITCNNPDVCNCNVDCGQQCGFDGPPAQGGEPVYCGDFGKCEGGSECPVIGGCPAMICSSTINGGSSGDTLTGNSNNECINGFDGADTLSGEAGDDTIRGGNGNDTIYGGSGNDCLYGDGGSDNANGDSGSDLCDAETEATCDL
jgi:Ca2+-binding RTX toxin-like protein